ncbi:ROK family protein [Butyrivibrio sp. MC2013]|uniref:ROK family protein n=1 Tax=Butyrivibrio sp. MC2013 TaxID=1280686 RepID=UPI0004284B2B|nr:ROK family protein [Butyrivibrio sp. MC2013]
MLLGALEAGGTKMVCAIVKDNGEILERVSYPTLTPDETLPVLADFFRDKGIEALGIGCFGPIDLNKESDTYGYITSTPKLAWRNTDIVGYFKKELNIPIGFDTDVNGSLLGEVTFGAAKGISDAIYLTIGTGIGGGVMSGGNLLHGMLHPEMGHILMSRIQGDDYAGKCPYHKTCFEGMCAGPAIEERWGKKGVELADRDEVWELESSYIAQALVSYILILSPKLIILGGGVMHQKQLFPIIRKKTAELLNGYLETAELKDMDNYIISPALGDDQGILGAAMLGLDMLK